MELNPSVEVVPRVCGTVMLADFQLMVQVGQPTALQVRMHSNGSIICSADGPIPANGSTVTERDAPFHVRQGVPSAA